MSLAALARMACLLVWPLAAWLVGRFVWPRLGPVQRREVGRGLALALLAAGPLILAWPHLDPVWLEALGYDGVLDADLTRVVETLTAFGAGQARTSVHPLQVLLFQPPAQLVSRLTGWPPLVVAQTMTASQLLLALLLVAAAATVATGRRGAGAVVGLLGAGSFAGWFAALAPESAGLAAGLVALPYLLLAVADRQPWSRAEAMAWLVAGVLALGVTTTCLIHPLAAVALRRWQLGDRSGVLARRVVQYCAQVAVVAALGAVVQAILFRGSGLWFVPGVVAAEARYLRPDWLTAQNLWATVWQICTAPLAGARFALSDHLLVTGRLAPQVTMEGQAAPLAALLAVPLVLTLAVAGWRTLPGRAATLALTAGALLHLVYGHNRLLYAGNALASLILLPALAVAARPRLVVLLLIGLTLGGTWSARAAFTANLERACALVGQQAVLALPGDHRLARVVVDPLGGFSPGIGTCGVRVVVADTASGDSSLGQFLRGEPTARGLAGPGLERLEFAGRAGTLAWRQTLSQLADRTVVGRLTVTGPGQGWVGIVVGRYGPASTWFPRQVAWSLDELAALVDGAPALVVSAQPTDVTLCRARDAFRHCFGQPVEPTADPSGASLVLRWRLDLAEGQEQTVTLRSPLAVEPLTGDGQPWATVLSLPPAYGPAPMPVPPVVDPLPARAAQRVMLDRLRLPDGHFLAGPAGPLLGSDEAARCALALAESRTVTGDLSQDVEGWPWGRRPAATGLWPRLLADPIWPAESASPAAEELAEAVLGRR